MPAIPCAGCGSGHRHPCSPWPSNPSGKPASHSRRAACSRAWRPRSWSTVRDLLRMLRLGIDVDGVVADFRTAFRALAERELGIAPDDVETELSKPDVDRLWRSVAGATNWWLDVPPY